MLTNCIFGSRFSTLYRAANAWNKKLPSSLQAKPTTGPPPGFSLKTDRSQHRARLLHLSLTLVGQKVILHQTNGAVVEGIFHNFTPFKGLPGDQKNVYVLKEIVVQQQASSEPALENGVTLSIPASKVVFVHAAGVASELKEPKASNGAPFSEGSSSKGGFQTDTQISSGTGGRVNDLVAAGNAWTSGGASKSLESGRGMRPGTNSRAAALAGNKQAAATGDISSGSIGEWDQFKANKELFNVNATFDENLYTTELDTSKIDSKKIKEAERIAKEIQNTTTDNIHMAEERGFKVETDFDEEDLYSGVLTKDGKQRHEKVTIAKKPSKEKDGKSTASKKVMNYAAAAAKADTTKTKSAPPGFSGSEASAATTKADDKKEKKADGSSSAVVTPEKTGKEESKAAEKSEPSKDSKSAGKDEEKTAEPKKSDKDKAAKDDDKKTEEKDKAAEKKTEKKEVKKSKLNANAKSFTFNPSAKSFTPSFGASNPTPPQPAATSDPNMPMYGGVPMQPPQYMQTGPMGQPGEYSQPRIFLTRLDYWYFCNFRSILVADIRFVVFIDHQV